MTAISTRLNESTDSLLRFALRADAVISGLAGIAAIPLAEPWAVRRLDLCVQDMAALPAAARLLVEHLTRR